MSQASEAHDLFLTIPKAEIHLHLEGSIELDTLLEMRRRRGEPAGAEARRKLGLLYAHRDFPHFLANFRDLCGEISGPGDFALATAALGERLRRDHVRYAEVMCSPLIFTRRGMPLDEIIDAIALTAASLLSGGGPRLRFLFDGVRQWGVGALEELIRMADACRARGVIGVGLGGDERALPSAAFAPAYQEARRLGLRTTVHAGEFDGPRSVWDAIDLLEVDRVGHGVRAAEDAMLVRALASRRIPLECCPTSNLRTGVVRSWDRHPIGALRAAGVLVTVNSDDPALFGTTLSEEWVALAGRLRLPPAEVVAIGADTVRASFAEDRFKQDLLEEQRRAAVLAGAIA